MYLHRVECVNFLCVFQVLIIGGGIGFTLFEVSRYSTIEKIDIVEIDDVVVDVSLI